MNNTAIVSLVLGVVLLAFGRKLFWFFVAVAGFLIGINVAEQLTGGPETTRLIIALVVGIIGAFVALFLQKVAIAAAGFVIGGYITVEILTLYGAVLPAARFHSGAYWIPYLIGGILGAILMFLLFDWALIVLSSLSGASMILRGVAVHRPAAAVLFVILVVLGILIQAHLVRPSRAAAS